MLTDNALPAASERMRQGNMGRHTLVLILAVFGFLFVGRLLGVFSIYFWEEDEISLAIGVAAMVADTPGDLYRYTVQLGYYHLVAFLDLLLGARVDLIPAVMKGLSAFAGALIPVAGFFAFRDELSERERWLVVLALAANPILWKSSQYGNTAIVAGAFAAIALAVLSNRPARGAIVAALGLFGIATLVRADTVLLAPIVLFLLERAEGSWRRAFAWSIGSGLAAVLVYAGFLVLDPRADGALAAVSQHMATARPTMFWEFLLWAMSPIPFALAVWGLRDLLDTKPRLALLLLVWCIPTLLFYFRATTTPRYFVNMALPFAVAGAVAINSIAIRLQTRIRPSLAWSGIVGLAVLHLFLAMGHFRPTWRSQPLRGATFSTHDGPMPTGALLYSTYFDQGSLLQSLPRPAFGASSTPFWEGPSFNRAMEVLADPAAPQRTVVVVLDGGWGHAFHWHTHAAGARFISEPLPGDELWEREIWFELGNSRVMTIAAWIDDYATLERFDVAAGDEIWALGTNPFPDSTALAKVPAGLELVATEPFDVHFRTFRVTERAAMGQ